MKILFLNNLSDPKIGGGGEVILWEQMRALRDIGHECVLLATSDEPGLKKNRKGRHNDLAGWNKKHLLAFSQKTTFRTFKAHLAYYRCL